MRAGPLRSKARLEREVRASDDRRGAAVTWDLVAEIRCSVDDAWARERLEATSEEAARGAAVLIRYRAGVKASMRLVVTHGPGTGTYNIRGVTVVKARGTGRPEALLLSCETGVPT